MNSASKLLKQFIEKQEISIQNNFPGLEWFLCLSFFNTLNIARKGIPIDKVQLYYYWKYDCMVQTLLPRLNIHCRYKMLFHLIPQI